MSGIFTDQTLDCLIQFMASQHLVPLKHELTPQTAFHLLLLYSYDQYKDEYVKFNSKLNESGHGGEWMNSTLQLPQPYKYYVHVPVYSNRSIETTCSLFDKFGNKRHFFTCRTHGQQNFNEFTSDGNTPTGLYTFDLNTPEDDPKEYGPYDVNRAVYGLKGNAFYIYPKIRSGILLHTGEWSSYHPMPNSHGCIHAQPQDIERIAQILKNDLGVVAHENLFGKYPYPFQQQGLLSVVQYSHDDEL
ncbi:hypothetical protein C9374_010245 [Naegleria lovaniensis]|uniref:L,D-TPase catalytic domain-containing protein n=1 Tax=Naegleria lovaniensis TaxID=51637 RepID=A0AA88KGG3_NAELO|nr:uncharacterized protein C9374_010245 [Naegleria lovaniensis]KAG2374871.1 hypothetical protein C9374_010245 [Naegleria lovaniensis]